MLVYFSILCDLSMFLVERRSFVLWSVDLVRIISKDSSHAVKLDHRVIDMKERMRVFFLFSSRSIIISSRVNFSTKSALQRCFRPKSGRLLSKISSSVNKPAEDDEETARKPFQFFFFPIHSWRKNEDDTRSLVHRCCWAESFVLFEKWLWSSSSSTDRCEDQPGHSVCGVQSDHWVSRFFRGVITTHPIWIDDMPTWTSIHGDF